MTYRIEPTNAGFGILKSDSPRRKETVVRPVWNSRTNPILAAYRRAVTQGGADLDVGRFATGATVSQIQHASKVFDRLAYLEGR